MPQCYLLTGKKLLLSLHLSENMARKDPVFFRVETETIRIFDTANYIH